MSIFYKMIIQSGLLCESECWVLTNHIKNKHNSFHRRSSRYITGRHIRLVNGVWKYPDSNVRLEMADVLPKEEYIKKRKSTVCEYSLSTDIYLKTVRQLKRTYFSAIKKCGGKNARKEIPFQKNRSDQNP